MTKTIPKSSIPVKEVKKTPAPKVASSGGHKVYQVASGDNLTKIAQKFYGNGNYDVIYQANRDSMKSPGDLRVGQTLVIPTLP